MKKLIALLLAIGMVVSLGACKKPAQGSGNTGTQASATGSANASTPNQEVVSGSEENQAAENPVAETEQPDWTMLKAFPVFAGLAATGYAMPSIRAGEHWERIWISLPPHRGILLLCRRS